MTTKFFQWQSDIQAKITTALMAARNDFFQFELDQEIFDHLLNVSTKGKQFRGCLLASFYAEVGDPVHQKAAINLAAAVELYGTALLIHDDVMDKSDMRRGEASTYKYFEDIARQKNIKNPEHFGISTAISVGDILFFLAESIILDLDIPLEIRHTLSRISSKELLLLGLAQVEDMRMAAITGSIRQQDILKMYQGKTGRYTGRWPLELAATLANVSADAVSQIAQVGEDIGVLFQLKDDELGLFGEETVIGKSTSSDITEGKKTLYYQQLKAREDSAEVSKVFSVIGDSAATSEEIASVKDVIKSSGVFAAVQQLMSERKSKLESKIDALAISDQAKQLLHQVTSLVLQRTK